MNVNQTEAFAWLLAQFHAYSRNRITWVQVKQILREADSLNAQFQASRFLQDDARTDYDEITD